MHEKVNQILCCIAWRPDWAFEVIDLADERRNSSPCAVVGVDIAAGEEHFDKVGIGCEFVISIESFFICLYALI